MDTIGTWRCIFDEENEPIFELASKYNLAVEIHPYDGEKFIKLENTAWRFHLIWMLAQCADAYHFFTLNGYADKFPNMRTCFAHGGQLAQINLGRRIQGFDGRPDLFEGKVHPRKSVAHPNIFFDTLVHDTGSLKLVVENQTPKQVLVGLDDPYPLGEMESAPQSSYPGKILDLAMERDIITAEEADAMWEDNVIQWLCGNDEEAKEKLVKRILGE
jgi:aminocarboxymuconate-semialdehyde decarboxylase